MSKFIWNINNFRGGISDNPYLWNEWQIQEAVRVDVQSEPKGFKLSWDYGSVLITASNPNVILDLADFWGSGIYTFCSAWEIYKDTSTTPIYTDATWSEIVNASAMWVSGTLYIYYFTAIWVIHRIATDWTWHTTKWALTGSTTYPLVKFAGNIYFGDKNVFRELDTNETLSAILTLPVDETITWVTFFQDQFKIYVRCWDATNPRNGKQYILWVGETAADYVTSWERLPILWACNIWSTDYVVVWAWPNYSDLYAVSGTQRQLLKSNQDGMSLWRKFVGKLVSWKDDAFILWWDNIASTSQNGNSVFRLWQFFPWLPIALTDIFKWWTWFTIYSIMASYNYIYIWYKTSINTLAVGKISISSPVETYSESAWYITTQIFDGWDATQKKTIDEIDISYMCDSTNPYFPHGWTIALYWRTSPWSSWSQIGSNYTKTDIWCIRILPNDIMASWITDFYQLELKCQITRWSTTTSPLVTWIRVYYSLIDSE